MQQPVTTNTTSHPPHSHPSPCLFQLLITSSCSFSVPLPDFSSLPQSFSAPPSLFYPLPFFSSLSSSSFYKAFPVIFSLL